MCRVGCARDPGPAAGERRARAGTGWIRPVPVILLLLTCWPADPAGAGNGGSPSGEPEGLAASRLAVVAETPRLACGWSGRKGDPPLPVVVPLGPAGVHLPDALDAALACAAERRLGIVARLVPPAPRGAATSPERIFSDWLEDVSPFLKREVGGLLAVEISPGRGLAPGEWAYIVEKISTLVRSFDAECPVVAGLPAAGPGGWRSPGLAARLRPYVDAVSIQEGRDGRAALQDVEEAWPAVPVWVHLQSDPGPAALLDRIHGLLARGVAQVSLPPGLSRESVETISSLITLLPSRYVPDPSPPEMVLEDPAGREPLGQWTDTLGPERAALLPGPGPGRPLRFHTAAGPVSRLRAFDLRTSRELAEIVTQEEKGRWLVKLAGATGPVLVRYVAGEESGRAEPESVGVTASVDLTAAEIIARLRSVEEAQRRATRHYTARATMSMHYSAKVLDESIDVTSVNRFYWKDGVGEYVELELYINGARWRGDPPSLPFIQPEKVKDVPIEIALDPSYGYRLAGREKVAGRPAYVLEFDPVSSGEALYSGRVWVDAETFTRLRIRLVQHGLEAPITGSEDVIEYGRPPGVPGDHWVPLSGYRQMVFTVLGRSLLVERKVEYTGFSMNGEQFEERRRAEYGSGRRIFRDDEEGYAYLIAGPGGERYRRSASLKNVAMFGRVSLGSPVISSPAAGLNYFDFDWMGTGTQVDFVFAGPVLQGAWTDPALGGSGWELSAEGRLVGIRQTLKRTTDEERRREEDLEVLQQELRTTLGRAVGARHKGEIQLMLTSQEFDPASTTRRRMTPPPDLLTTTSLARWRYHRSGVSLDLWGSVSWRGGWDDWGFRAAALDPNTSPTSRKIYNARAGAGGSAEDDRYARWGLSLGKSFFPGGFHKIGLELDLAAGSGLDRFSRLRLGEFGGAKVEGFNGRKLTYDRGAAARISWLATLPRGGVSLSFDVEGAVLENKEDFSDSREEFASGRPSYREYVLGAGVGVSFNGPWGTLMTVSTGAPVASSISFSRSAPSFSVIMIKTFGDWPWKKSPVEEDPRLAGRAVPGGEPGADRGERR